METVLLCKKCKQELRRDSQGFSCDHCKASYPIVDGVISLFDPHAEPESFASLEALTHDEEAPIAEEFMGLYTYYNRHTHSYIYQQMAKWVSKDKKILEIGSGVGQDIVALAQQQYNQLHASDVSLKSIIKARHLAQEKGVTNYISFYHFDGSYLPFKDQEFDVVFMVAALHHFPVTADILREMKRCCKRGGFLMCFIEPNSLYYSFFRPLAKAFETALSYWRRPKDQKRSIAEETAQGFTISTFYELARQAELEVVTIKSHWVFTGFVYLLQQFCFRIMGIIPYYLLNRISRLTCLIDDRVTSCPTSFCWHYSVIYRVQ